VVLAILGRVIKMSEIVDVALEGVFHGFTSAGFGEELTKFVVSAYVESVIGEPNIESKIADLERAVALLDQRVSELERVVNREILRDYLDQINEGKSRATLIRGTMRTLISLLIDGEQNPNFIRPQDVDSALIDMENQLNALSEESIYTYTVASTTPIETRFDPRFTLPFYIQGMNLYVASLARWFPSRLSEQRIRDLITFHASKLEYFVNIIKSQIKCIAEVFTAEEPRQIPGTQLTHYVLVLVARNAAMCKADGYLNRRVLTGWQSNFEPRIAGPFSVRVYNEIRKDSWTEEERNQLIQWVHAQIPVVFKLGECARLALDEMLANAATWRYTVAVAESPHPLGLNVSWENGRGVVIRFHAAGFNTTNPNPVRLYRYPDFTGEDGRSLPVNQPVEIVDPFPFYPGETFGYTLTVWSHEFVNGNFVKLSGDSFDFRHPIVVYAQDWRTRDEVLNGRADIVDVPSAEQLGLRVIFNVVQDFNYAEGEVIAIEPPYGTPLLPGSEIIITVNDG
jgi:hypothetical protein